jgi:hypothetical protein
MSVVHSSSWRKRARRSTSPGVRETGGNIEIRLGDVGGKRTAESIGTRQGG